MMGAKKVWLMIKDENDGEIRLIPRHRLPAYMAFRSSALREVMGEWVILYAGSAEQVMQMARLIGEPKNIYRDSKGDRDMTINAVDAEENP